MSLCVSYKCIYIVHVQEGAMAYFVGEQFDEFVQEAKLSQLLMEPLATVLDTRLQQLQWKRGRGGREAEGRRERGERQGDVKSQNKTRLIVEGSRRGVSALTVRASMQTFSLSDFSFGTIIFNATCGLQMG